ncbi:hypothetical protein HaLaN_22649 [Haematococcus lacustris]|uniref:Uncharacterized protein n=1 Tax=Haematococcus lacustris TaxID=44745 RepID=A0A699ZR49_HAELA|nr:hypothetical protein HaLaN_22649 [Haematococcus lacustris]
MHHSTGCCQQLLHCVHEAGLAPPRCTPIHLCTWLLLVRDNELLPANAAVGRGVHVPVLQGL